MAQLFKTSTLFVDLYSFVIAAKTLFTNGLLLNAFKFDVNGFRMEQSWKNYSLFYVSFFFLNS